MWIVTIFSESNTMTECFYNKRDANEFIYRDKMFNSDRTYMINYSRMF